MHLNILEELHTLAVGVADVIEKVRLQITQEGVGGAAHARRHVFSALVDLSLLSTSQAFLSDDLMPFMLVG